MSLTCDFCGEPMEWTEEQKNIDLVLTLLGSGLGACCGECDDKQIAIVLKEMEEEMGEEE